MNNRIIFRPERRKKTFVLYTTDDRFGLAFLSFFLQQEERRKKKERVVFAVSEECFAESVSEEQLWTVHVDASQDRPDRSRAVTAKDSSVWVGVH